MATSDSCRFKKWPPYVERLTPAYLIRITSVPFPLKKVSHEEKFPLKFDSVPEYLNSTNRVGKKQIYMYSTRFLSEKKGMHCGG